MAPSFWQILIVLAIVVALFASRYRTWQGRQLRRDLDQSPVFSAETVKNKEAQYTRHPSAARIVSWAISGIIVALVIAASWWAATQ